MTKEEVSVLLYLETCAVDRGGIVNGQRINAEDRAIINGWVKDGYLQFGRVASECISRDGALWVRLSGRALADAHAARIARIERMWNERQWYSTDEKRAAAV